MLFRLKNAAQTFQRLKVTVPPDFLPLVFFFKQLLLAPVDKPSNDFDFFRIFAEIFDFSGASRQDFLFSLAGGDQGSSLPLLFGPLSAFNRAWSTFRPPLTTPSRMAWWSASTAVEGGPPGREGGCLLVFSTS
jgi:hypothetical protein